MALAVIVTAVIVSALTAALIPAYRRPRYSRFAPAKTTRRGENIEWSINYIYNNNDTRSPRVLLIGDSICNGYQELLRDLLSDKCNISFWASSYCVTDRAYFRNLDYFLAQRKVDAVLFNNGAHSFTSNPNEWSDAYRRAIGFIRASLPDIPLMLVNTTPIREDADGRVARINEMTRKIADETGTRLLDLNGCCSGFAADMWTDNYHFVEKARRIQAEFLAGEISGILPEVRAAVVQSGTETGPSGKLE